MFFASSCFSSLRWEKPAPGVYCVPSSIGSLLDTTQSASTACWRFRQWSGCFHSFLSSARGRVTSSSLSLCDWAHLQWPRPLPAEWRPCLRTHLRNLRAAAPIAPQPDREDSAADLKNCKNSVTFSLSFFLLRLRFVFYIGRTCIWLR